LGQLRDMAAARNEVRGLAQDPELHHLADKPTVAKMVPALVPEGLELDAKQKRHVARLEKQLGGLPGECKLRLLALLERERDQALCVMPSAIHSSLVNVAAAVVGMQALAAQT